MELREFISKTLFEIQAGVNDAIQKSKSESIPGAINPVWGGAKAAGRQDVQVVKFDIAVVVSESGNNDIGGGIKVLGVGINGKSSEAKENSHTSRIEFTVPIIPPVHALLSDDA